MFILLFLTANILKPKPINNHPDAYLVMQRHKAKIGHLLFYVYMYLHLDHLRVWEDIKEEWKVSSSLHSFTSENLHINGKSDLNMCFLERHY